MVLIPPSLRPPIAPPTLAQIREAKLPQPSAPVLVEQTYAPSEELKKVEFELQDINKNISIEQQRVSDLQNRLATEQLSSQEANALQDNIAIAQADIRGLDKARNLLHQGYSVKSAQDIATYESNKARALMDLQNQAQELGYANITEYRKAVETERRRIATERIVEPTAITKPIDIPPPVIIPRTKPSGFVTPAPERTIFGRIRGYGKDIKESTIFGGTYETSPFYVSPDPIDFPKKETISVDIKYKPSIPSISSVGVWKPEFKEQYYQKPISQVAEEFKDIVVEDVKSFIGVGGRQHDYTNPFEAFRGYGRRIAEIKSPQYSAIIKRGTIAPTEAPYYTYGELQTQQDIDTQIKIESIKGKYIKEISETHKALEELLEKGEITLEEANKLLLEELDKIDLSINKDVGKIKVPPRYYSKTKQVGAGVTEASVFAVEMGAYLHPFTAVIMGTRKFETAETIPEKLVASSYLVGAGFGTFGRLRATERAIIKEELMGLGKQPVKFGQIQYVTPDKTRAYLKGGQTFRGLKTEIEIVGDIYKVGEKGFIMPKGYGIAGTRGELTWTLAPKGKPTYVVGASEFLVGGKGVSIEIGETGKLFGTIAVETTIPTKATGYFFTTQPYKPYLRFPSPKIKFKPSPEKLGKELAKELQDNVIYGGTISKELTTSLSYKFEPELFGTITGKKDIGLTKIFYAPDKKAVRWISPADIKRTPLSKTFGDVGEVVIQKQAPSITGSFLQPSIKRGAKISAEATIKQIPKTTQISPLVFGLGETRFKDFGVLSTRFDVGLGESRFRDMGVLSTKFDVIEKEKVKERLISRAELKLREKEAIKEFGISKPMTTSIIKTAQKEAVALIQPSKVKEVQITEQEQQAQALISPITTITPKPSVTPVPVGFGGFGFFFAGERIPYQKKEQVGYNAYAMKGATTTGKHWKKLNTKPLTKSGSFDVSARYVDENISARGKIESIKHTRTIKGKKKLIPKMFKKLTEGDNYFQIQSHKFRGKIIKGKEQPIHNTFYEKKIYRADHKQETKTLVQEAKKERLSSFIIPPLTRSISKKKKSKKRRTSPHFFRL